MDSLFLNIPVQVLVMLPFVIGIIILLVIWEMIWKGIAMWKAGRNNQMGWYIAILILNTLGILPIVYLLFFQKKEKKFIRKVRK